MSHKNSRKIVYRATNFQGVPLPPRLVIFQPGGRVAPSAVAPLQNISGAQLQRMRGPRENPAASASSPR